MAKTSGSPSVGIGASARGLQAPQAIPGPTPPHSAGGLTILPHPDDKIFALGASIPQKTRRPEITGKITGKPSDRGFGNLVLKQDLHGNFLFRHAKSGMTFSTRFNLPEVTVAA